MMMRSSLTAVLEKHLLLDAPFTTEPYELPWADEARFFVHTLDQSGPGAIHCSTEISPDGLHWCDSGTPHQQTDGPGLISWPVAEFGQWLRVHCRPGDGVRATVRIYLVGKS